MAYSDFKVGDFVRFNHEDYGHDEHFLKDEVGIIFEIMELKGFKDSIIEMRHQMRVFYAGIQNKLSRDGLWTILPQHLIKV